MELQELYTSFLPKKAKGEARQCPAPSQIYLSSNMQKLKLMKMEKEKERKKSQAFEQSFAAKNENYNTQQQQPFQSHNEQIKDDIKRSKSFNQSPYKQGEAGEVSYPRNQSIPFEQYVNMQMANRQKQPIDENNASSFLFQNSTLIQINNKYGNSSIMSTNRHSALNSKNLYSNSIVSYEQSGVVTRRNNLINTSLIQQAPEQQKQSKQQIQNIDLSFQFAIENNLIRDSLDHSKFIKDFDEYKQLQKKCQDQREKSPMNIYFQQYNQQQTNNIYDRYYPHYQVKIDAYQESSPKKKLGDVMGGKMRNYVPSELRNIDNEYRNQTSNREGSSLLSQRFTVNNKIQENISQYNSIQPEGQSFTNQLGILAQAPASRQSKRGKSSISSNRPNTYINNVQQPISTKVIKPPLSLEAHQNKESNVIPQNNYETTVNGEKQTYIIPLQQNYSVCINEIDRIKARRKHLFSKRGHSSNGDLQPFSQEDSKLQFLNKINQSRQTPKNNNQEMNQSNRQKVSQFISKNQKQYTLNDSIANSTLDEGNRSHVVSSLLAKKVQKVDFQNQVNEPNQLQLNNSLIAQKKHTKSYL